MPISSEEHSAASASPSIVELVVGPRARPLAGLEVNRAWPTARRRLIGPFIFFDHLRPAELAPGRGLDVPPHPHIGLATVTYLFEGTLTHADSLGVRQDIRPGELNWMTAGRGITHAERTTAAERARASRIHGTQAWVALPLNDEECEPSFEHYPASRLPVLERPGIRLKLIAGAGFGKRSPVRTRSNLFYAEADLEDEARLLLDAGLGERGVYIVAGAVSVGPETHEAGRMLVMHSGLNVELTAVGASKLMLLGGAPLGGDRRIWWNFVSSSAARIEQAKSDWKGGRFPRVPGDDEFMPLPE